MLSTTELMVIDEDASVPAPIVLRSAWGRAVRTPRDAWPYDFQPLLYAGAQVWADRALLVPPILGSILPSDCFGHGSGAFVSLDQVPPPYDSMEFVFAASSWPEPMPDEVYMAWVILDPLPRGVDPFVVTASRVLEPLIGELRSAIDRVEARGAPLIEDLLRHVDALSAAVRDAQAEPSRMRKAVTMSLAALSGIVLNIVANRIDPVIDRIDWPSLYNAVLEAIRRLALAGGLP